ncbi:MAG: alpha/beta hydrolase [Maricaulaceae bacterium]
MLNAIKVWVLRNYYKITNRKAWRGHISEADWSDVSIAAGPNTGEASQVAARLYHAGGAAAEKPLIVYFHGGGWVIGDIKTHHPFCAGLSAATGCSVVSVDYRLAPEHPYPAAHDDCLAAVRGICADMTAYGPSNGQIVLAGDSAGANLALCTALGMEELKRRLAGIISIYPVTDHYAAEYPSYKERVKGQILTDDLMQFFWDNYLKGSNPNDPALERIYPLRSQELASLPRTLMMTAQMDPLRDEGFVFTKKLQEVGVETASFHYDEFHGFACGDGPSKGHLALMDEIKKWMAA